MTDARFPERWLMDHRIQTLSGEAYKLFGNALMWAVSNRTDGMIPAKLIHMIPFCDHSCIPELVETGAWTSVDNGWIIAEFDTSQTTSAELARAEHARKMERDKKARQRKRESDVPVDVPTGRPGTAGRGKSQDRKGHGQSQDTLGEEEKGITSEREEAADVDDHPSPRPDALAVVSPDRYSGSDLDEFTDPYFAELEEEERQRREEWGEQDAG